MGEMSSSYGIYIVGQEPSPELTIEKANQLFAEIETENEFAK